MDKLEPCIFCLGEGVPVTHTGTKGATPFTSCRFFRGYIKCKKCGFTSTVKNNPKAMTAAWNRGPGAPKEKAL
jgi:hypothetical protein